jgi:hypothetical protein
MVTTREKLHQLIDQLPRQELRAAERYLEYLRDSQGALPSFLAEAPIDDEPETPEEAAAVAEAWEDVSAGRLVSHEEAQRRLLRKP